MFTSRLPSFYVSLLVEQKSMPDPVSVQNPSLVTLANVTMLRVNYTVPWLSSLSMIMGTLTVQDPFLMFPGGAKSAQH